MTSATEAMMTRRCLVLGCVLWAASGCTHVQLQKNSVRQAATVHDLQQQQVLDNLAMFVYDYNSMPYFSYANQSGAQVTDQANASASLGWGRVNEFGNLGTSEPHRVAPFPFPFLFNALGLAGGGQRSQQEAFTVTPVNDPRKLELMRCAYQLAVSHCGRDAVSATCPDCQTRFKVFYTGDPNGDIRQGANGIVTSECLKSDCCWFHIGCKKCLPKKCPCMAVGEYCGCYVWVLPEGQDQLTKLTLTILDYALHEPPVKRTKQVDYNIDEYGLPTTSQRAVGKVTAQVAIDEHVEGLLKIDQADEARIEQFLDYRHKHVKERLAATTNPEERKALLDEDQMLQNKLDFLHEQLRTRRAPRAVLSPFPVPHRTESLATGHVSEHHAQLRGGALTVAWHVGCDGCAVPPMAAQSDESSPDGPPPDGCEPLPCPAGEGGVFALAFSVIRSSMVR